jgi:hypothetical protein
VSIRNGGLCRGDFELESAEVDPAVRKSAEIGKAALQTVIDDGWLAQNGLLSTILTAARCTPSLEIFY